MPKKGKRARKPRFKPKHGGHGSKKFGRIEDAPLAERVWRMPPMKPAVIQRQKSVDKRNGPKWLKDRIAREARLI